MMQGRARIRYSPTFNTDLDETVYYIAAVLQNPDAAERFVHDVENAIEERSLNPEIFSVYGWSLNYSVPYYRIIVGNFIVLYVVLTEDNEKIMEVRRLLYGRRNISLLIFGVENREK